MDKRIEHIQDTATALVGIREEDLFTKEGDLELDNAITNLIEIRLSTGPSDEPDLNEYFVHLFKKYLIRYAKMVSTDYQIKDNTVHIIDADDLAANITYDLIQTLILILKGLNFTPDEEFLHAEPFAAIQKIVNAYIEANHTRQED